MMHAPSLFRLREPLVLASASPRRREFLTQLGIECRFAAPPDHAEPSPLPGENPAAFAARAARAKAESVRETLGGEVAVLGADTVVYHEDVILGKPRNAAEALAFLEDISGRAHYVRTACHLFRARSECGAFSTDAGISFFGEAEVTMGAWPRETLMAYAATGEGLDKAGGYAVQGLGSFLVTAVHGSWSAVIGLPVAETVRALLDAGVIEVAPSNP
ncbi:MAG: dTTP/UTP pyrophosphatase [Desulfovibrio sp.]